MIRVLATVLVFLLLSPMTASAAKGLARYKSGPIAISRDGAAVWVVNSDANSVTRIAAGPDTVVAEIPVGRTPKNLAIAPNGSEVWVTNHESNTVSIVSAATNTVVATLPTLLGPYGVVLSPNGTKAYVVNQVSDSLLTFDVATRTVIDRDPVGHRSRAIAITSDGSRIMVQQWIAEWGQMITSFLDENGGSLSAASLGLAGPVPQGDGGFAGCALGISVGPGDSILWVPDLDQNWDNGPIKYPGEGQLTLNSTMQAVVREVRISDRTEILEHSAGGRRRLNTAGANVQMPADIAFTADGAFAYIPCAFSNDVLKIATRTNPPSTLLEIPVGDYPNGIAISPTAERAYVSNAFSRNVMVLNTASDAVIDTITTTAETLAPNILNGMKLFFTSTGRMSTNARITCAGCHPDGYPDGFNWDFTQFGNGRRNTRSPRVLSTYAPLLSPGTWDEIQDGEWSIQGVHFGEGLADGTDNPPVGAPNAGRSQDLDDLAAFVHTLAIRDESPARNPDQSLTASAAAGKVIFDSDEAGCRFCHPEPLFTDKLRHDVGTYLIETDAGGCEGCHPPMSAAVKAEYGARVLTSDTQSGYLGYVTPTLCSIYDTDPYLHNGKARYLQSVVGGLNPHDEHGQTTHLTTEERYDLIAYLRSIVRGREDVTPPRIEFVRATDVTEVVVRFLEPVDPASATDIGNYSIDNGVSVMSASLEPFSTFMGCDGLTVHLYTSPHAPATTYTLTVQGVKDASMNGNTAAASATYEYAPQATFVFSNIDSLYTSRLARDAYMDEGAPTWNFGRSADFRVGKSGATRRGLLLFDFYPMLSTIVADSSDIVSAKIRLRLRDQAAADSVTIYAYRLLRYFAEGSGGAVAGQANPNQTNWNSIREGRVAWGASGASQNVPGCEGDVTADYLAAADRAFTPEDSARVAATGEFYEWDVTRSVRWRFANPLFWDFGHVFVAADEVEGSEKIFCSLEDSVEAYRPQLVVTVRADAAVGVPFADAGASSGYALAPSRPNPTRGNTTFAFALPKPEHVTLRLFDASGRAVRVLSESAFPAGVHEIAWDGKGGDGSEAASGTYFYRIKAGRFSQVGRLTVVR